MYVGDNIKALRESKALTQKQFGELFDVTDKAVSTWENHMSVPRYPVLEKIADYFHIPVSAIIEPLDAAVTKIYPWYVPGKGTIPEQMSAIKHLEPLHAMNRVPLLGSIACGQPITAEENVEDMIAAPDDLRCHFALRCKGDSMSPRVMDGDLVYIRQQPDVEDGQIAAVVIEGEATLKHVYHINGGVQLVSDNPLFHPLIYTGSSCEALRIVGLAVAYQRKLI